MRKIIVRAPRRSGAALAMLLVGALASTPAGAQPAEAPEVFDYIQIAPPALQPQQENRLQAYRADPTTADISFVRLHPAELKAADAATLNLPGGGSVLLDVIRVEERAADDYSWFGSQSAAGETADEATLVIMGTDIVGTVRSGGELYRVRPLEGGAHVLIRVDQTQFPEEHPPVYEEMERQPFQPQPDLRQGDLQDSCDEYTAIVAYTPAAKTEAGNIDALIQLAIDETNQGYMNSQVNTRIKLVHKYETSYTESSGMATDRDRFRIPGDGFMDEVHTLRDSHAADVGLLITKSGDFCGIASAIGATEDTAFGVVGQNCATGYYSFAHEIGHLQSARHNPEADPTNTPFAFGHGFFHAPGSWRTVMSYDCPSGCTRQNYWSNPNVTFGGVAMGTAATHHNASVLNQTACTIANFRTSAPTGSGPLAFGVLWSDGAKQSGTSNWSSTYNSTYQRYEINISGESYYYTQYTTNVTAAGDARFCRTDSVGGNLLVYCFDHNGNPATSRLAFVTYKK
jgi:peptidyl-Asp metalloendopeptidase